MSEHFKELLITLGFMFPEYSYRLAGRHSKDPSKAPEHKDCVDLNIIYNDDIFLELVANNYTNAKTNKKIKVGERIGHLDTFHRKEFAKKLFKDIGVQANE